MIFSGLVGATIAGFILDYTKKFKEVAVMSLALAILCFLWFYEASALLGVTTCWVSCPFFHASIHAPVI